MSLEEKAMHNRMAPNNGKPPRLCARALWALPKTFLMSHQKWAFLCFCFSMVTWREIQNNFGATFYYGYSFTSVVSG